MNFDNRDLVYYDPHVECLNRKDQRKFNWAMMGLQVLNSIALLVVAIKAT